MAYSPQPSTPVGGGYYAGTPNAFFDYETADYVSPSPTPSPRHYYAGTPAQPHQARPATRAHFRTTSANNFTEFSSPGVSRHQTATPSPRFTSSGAYATLNVSSRKHSSSTARPDKRERRSSYSYYRASDHYGESDEDEFIEINGVTYVLPARARGRRRYSTSRGLRNGERTRYETDDYYYVLQSGYSTPARERDPAGFTSPRYEPQPQPEPARRSTHSRRNSTSVPQRPQTARPSSSHHKKSAKKEPAAAPTPRRATEEDAKKARIPAGYSLKNWDPSERPILLLGSVFDANSLGKWIYDWTVFAHTAEAPLSDVAGDLWLLLIQLSGKLKRSDEVMPKIRSRENREMVSDFMDSGDRLMARLRKLLRTCEAYMLKPQAGKPHGSGQLSKNAGVAFVDSMFGADREMHETEVFMSQVRLWNMRFDANCEEILRHPTA